jgi:hypothetical protein
MSALDDMRSTQLEEMLDFMEAAPKLRSRSGWTRKDILRGRVLGFYDLSPDSD